MVQEKGKDFPCQDNGEIFTITGHAGAQRLKGDWGG